MALGLLLHDVAMNKVPAFILNKNTPLKQDEKDKIPPHVLGGMQIAQKMELVEEEVRAACLEHHERLDGSGYPQRMKGTQISSMGAMAAVADSFSAMLQKRVYAEAKTPAAAAGELVNAAHLYEKRFSAALQAAFVAGAFSSGSRAG
jgi:HD-GYP domain-containing protein (c-di-GMP phosphodiesterase class II)